VTEPVKCVVWDLDGTVWDGVAIEAPEGEPVAPRPEVLDAMWLLERRGIVNSAASRTDPSMLKVLARNDSLRHLLVQPRLDWRPKSELVSDVAATLGIATGACLLVDDSAFERAEVAHHLPDVRVRAPREFLAALDAPEVNPPSVTADAAARVDRYRTEAHRAEVARDAASEAEFLAAADLRLTVGTATIADAERLAELAARTHRLNSGGEVPGVAEVAERLRSGGWTVLTGRLADRFGDYGLVAAAFVRRGRPLLSLLAVSCRVAGRGVPDALLRAVVTAHPDVAVAVRALPANTDLRILLRRYGFRPDGETGDGALLLRRAAGADVPDAPPWLAVEDRR
jgi:methoxymalonate biosynthesis protein